MSKRLVMLGLCAVFACTMLVAACGGDDKGGGTGGAGGTKDTGQTAGAKAVDPKSMDSAKGNVTYCTGKDTSGDLKEGVKEFNAKNPGLTAKLLEFPESADEQRNQFIQRQRAKAADCDGFEADVVWTAEFASQKWLLDMTPYVEARKDEFIPSTLSSVTYEGKNWGVPRASDAGLLYYRTDQVKEVPATWQDVYKQAADGKGIVYQGASYEGLTVNFLELAFAAGGKVLSDDGKKPEINSPANVKALQFMVDGVKNGAAPKAVTTYMEEEARRAFEAGKATFERQWPYAYALGNMKGSKVKGKFKVAAYPPFEGGGKAAILGGHNMVISAFSKNPGGALKLIDYLTSTERITKNAVDFSKTPVLTASFEDPAVKKALPFVDELKQAVEQAKSRPVSPVYSQISQAIYKNVNNALSGQAEPQAALEKASKDMEKALATF
ncbi:MAG TPA: ABC transporter substrate-binding protein [Solirubrobacteraceae bacterium]|nr:ABC transporter substrate-binding protein [Solirubrobacteraceae bacterium]